jgi:hypothetical protein
LARVFFRAGPGRSGNRAAGVSKCRDLQIKIYRQLALLNHIPKDVRVAQFRAELAKMQSIASEWLEVERDFRQQYGDEDDGPRAFSV